MRTLRYLVLAILFLIVITVIIGFLLPSKVHLERSILIERDPNKVFTVINSLKNFNKWSPWYPLDTNAVYTYSGADVGVGSRIDWNGNENVGTGSNEIVESVQDSYIRTKFYFGKSDQPAHSKISLMQVNNHTKVTWAFNNDFGYNVFYRYFGLVLEDMIAPDYEKGLINLKSYVESLPNHDYSNISIVNTTSKPLYTVLVDTNPQTDNIASAIGSAFAKIIKFIDSNHIKMMDSPRVITLKAEDNIFNFKAAIPVDINIVKDDLQEIIADNSYQGKAIKIIHHGAYSHFNTSYEILESYMNQHNLNKNGNQWEEYVTDPGKVKEANLVTHIYQPIQD